jgi:hypothetical protein
MAVLSSTNVPVNRSLQSAAIHQDANLALANALNSSAMLLQNNAYGASWLRPSYILPGRLIRPSVQIDF